MKNIKEGSFNKMTTFTPLLRSSKDICIQGLKGSGKSYFVSIKAKECYDKGFNIYSNYKLNFPYNHIETIEDLLKIQPDSRLGGICILDDIERWISCRTWSSRKTQNIMEIILNLGKKGAGVSLWYTVKIFDNVDKWVRDCTDLIANVTMQMITLPESYDFYESYNVLENLALIVQYMRIDGEMDSTEIIWNLHKHKDLYDTTELIKDIKK